jgi:NAD(P)-dependent dehydrogenase (short-subunit alcohol dehydrogenase family)
MSLEGKVAIVTGAAGTMGRTIGQTLVKCGAKLMLADLNLQKAEEVAKDMRAACKVPDAQVAAGLVNVTEEDSVAKLFENIKETFGRCDILVNSAGIMLKPTPTEDHDAGAFGKLMAVNVTGSFLCAKHAMKIMKEQGGGRIVNVGSLAAFSPRPDAIAYTTSKFAVKGLTQSLALDARKYNIAVSMIHPGNVLSDLISEAEVAQRRAQGEDFMDPQVVADGVLHMCSVPGNTTVHELTVFPTVQAFVGRG